MSEEKQPWDQMDGESDVAYGLLLKYSDIPTHIRSVRELHRRQHVADPVKSKQSPSSTWYEWRKEFKWESRARALHRHRLFEERSEIINEQKTRLQERLDTIDEKIKHCLEVVRPQQIADWAVESPATVVSLLKTLTDLRSKTEQEILGVNTLEVQESPRQPTEQEQDEIAQLIASLQQKSNEGNAAASKLLLKLNGVSL